MPEDERIIKQMEEEGKVKVPNFRKMVKDYFKEEYNKDGSFDFISAEYTFYDPDHKVFSLEEGKYVSRPENRKVRDSIPIFIEDPKIDLRTLSIKIPGVIDYDKLDEEVAKELPKGISIISWDEIDKILDREGYTEPLFDHYFYSIMDYPSFNVYAKPKEKGYGTR